MTVSLLPGRPLDPAAALVDAVLAALAPDPGLVAGDAVVVPASAVSRAEGRAVAVPDRAALEATIAAESVRVLRHPTPDGPGVAETRHGFVCADAGVEVPPGEAVALLLPVDPDRSARRLRAGLEARTGVRLAAVVASRFDDPWRRGGRAVAVGCAGLSGVLADDLAAAAHVAGRGALPVVVRGLDPSCLTAGSVAADAVLPAGQQRFR